MSAIASFVRLPLEALPLLKQAASPGNLLSARGTVVAHYRWSGYVLATLLPYLSQRRQVDLMGEEIDLTDHLCGKLSATCCIFTSAQKDKHLDFLRAELFSVDELRDYYNQFNATKEVGVGEAMLDGVRAIHKSLAALDANSAIVLRIG